MGTKQTPPAARRLGLAPALALCAAVAGCGTAVVSDSPERLWQASVLAIEQMRYDVVEQSPEKGVILARRTLTDRTNRSSTLDLEIVLTQRTATAYAAHVTVQRPAAPVEYPLVEGRSLEGRHTFHDRDSRASIEFGDGPIRDSAEERRVRERIAANLRAATADFRPAAPVE